ncbi:uncharacterized protein [Spinacia oleracea]|uniref:Uncharacterized protein isoform X2 n=1 Tax=Spinacia oleracea TaxID=3562 RepID=A0ABM3QM75_SPIOL|nr:uncharacterized protein LOC110803613 isoform X2 [Spinacia oleracea]
MEYDVRDLYPLTSLQIGDVQSYLSQAYLFFAIYSHKFLILVDNHSWRMNNNHSKSTHLRELFATKYRTSPFKNSRALLRRVSARYKDNSISSNAERKKLYRWVSVVNSQRRRARAFFSLVDLHVALHGFIVFEVYWKDIRGINYFSELQTDVSMAFEVKSMRKWDFHSIDQASSCIQTWFSGSKSETESLWKCLMSLDDKVPSSPLKVRVSFTDLLLGNGKHAKSLSGDDFFDVRECHHATDPCCEHKPPEKQNEQKTPRRQQDTDIQSMHYEDTLLKFYFDDRDLPFTFKRIITSDPKLLTLLESGLPSWVIFLQSYPLFCKVYRPWMRPLVRTLYVLISLVTCVIGFYDLYKNVPVLKAASSHICGPLFIWIEDWDMISRVRYLGTMLFLQNFEKAMRWSLKIGRVFKLLLLLLTKPLMEPLQDLVEFTSPVWILFCEAGYDFYNMVSFALMFLCDLVVDLFELLFSPFQLLYSYIITIVSFFIPIFASIWELCRVPLQMCSPMANHAASFCGNIYEGVQGMLTPIVNKTTDVGQLATNLSKAKTTTKEVSVWSSLWKDLFSKVFRSLRSISYGVIAFLDTCNRHRLRCVLSFLSFYFLPLSPTDANFGAL